MHTRQNVRALHILHFYANILPRRSTSLHTTEKTSEGSPRASNVRRTPLSSAPLAMKSPSWNWLLMGTREIGKLCDLFACRPDLNSRTCIYHSPIHSLHTLSTSRAQRESGGLWSQGNRPVLNYGGLGPLEPLLWFYYCEFIFIRSSLLHLSYLAPILVNSLRVRSTLSYVCCHTSQLTQAQFSLFLYPHLRHCRRSRPHQDFGAGGSAYVSLQQHTDRSTYSPHFQQFYIRLHANLRWQGHIRAFEPDFLCVTFFSRLSRPLVS
jgi:hypothetical protein